MSDTEIQDWQFGQLRKEEIWGTWGWFSERVEWTPGKMNGVCIQTELTESKTIPELARTMFDGIKDKQDEYLSLASPSLVDTFNNIWTDDEDYRPENWPFDAHSFVNGLTLKLLIIDAERESELQYSTDGGPLLRVLISPDLTFKKAFFD